MKDFDDFFHNKRVFVLAFHFVRPLPQLSFSRSLLLSSRDYYLLIFRFFFSFKNGQMVKSAAAAAAAVAACAAHAGIFLVIFSGVWMVCSPNSLHYQSNRIGFIDFNLFANYNAPILPITVSIWCCIDSCVRCGA